eukprot:1891352-Amphidinium_carterae.1
MGHLFLHVVFRCSYVDTHLQSLFRSSSIFASPTLGVASGIGIGVTGIDATLKLAAFIGLPAMPNSGAH